MNWHLDDDFRLDWSAGVISEMESTTDSVDVSTTMYPLYDKEDEIIFEDEIDVIHSVALDLLQLVPAKFRSSQILIDYLQEAGLLLGDQLTKIRDIPKLLGPNTVSSIEYLRYLGSVIGVSFPPEDETTEEEMRKTLSQAIDWYKMKGTYHSVLVVALIQAFTVNLYDMYTNDYSNFYLVDWFVGGENENPSGFDASYYKSPHFAVEVLLNQVKEVDSGLFLWRSEYLDNLYNRVEETRPVHTVPHYMILLNPKTDEFGHVIEVSGQIKTRVTSDWEYGIKYFDMEGSGEAWNFDDGTFFDQSAEAFVKSITKWVLGTGSCDLEGSNIDIQVPILEGSINPDNITVEIDKIRFEFVVPKNIEQDGISELGLYIPGVPDTLMVISNFPMINKDNRTEIHVIVEVYNKDLSI